MRSLPSFLLATLLLSLTGCSEPAPVQTPPPEPVEAAPAEAAPAAVEEASTVPALGEAAPEASAAVSGVHSGRVVYEAPGAVGHSKPLAGATVSQHGAAAGPKATTNAEGSFSLTLVDSESPAVLISAKGYVSALRTLPRDRTAGDSEPVMLFARADEASISLQDYGMKYDVERGGLVLAFQSRSGEQSELAGLSTSISANNAGGFLFPANPTKKGTPTKGSKLGEDNDAMVFYPGVAPGRTEIVVTPPSGIKCAGSASADVLADTYTTVVFECS